MNTRALIIRAANDEALSSRARGTLLRLTRLADRSGRIPSKSDACSHFREGREALSRDYDELEVHGYVKSKHRRLNGRFETTWWLAGAVAPERVDRSGNPVTPLQVTSDKKTDDNQKPSASGHAPRRAGEEHVVAESFWDAKPAAGDEGATGRLRDEPKAETKIAKPVDKYTVPDLVAAFQQRAVAATKRTAQVNRGALSGRMAAWRKDGVSQATILAGMDMFFADPRTLRDVGNGKPLWIKFLTYFPDHQEQAARRAGDEKSPLTEMAEEIAAGGSPVLGKVHW